jgi:hypothetical protein
MDGLGKPRQKNQWRGSLITPFIFGRKNAFKYGENTVVSSDTKKKYDS